MTSFCFKILLLFLLFSAFGFAQTTSFVYEPETTININTESRWSFNFKVSYRRITNNEPDSRLEGDHTDFSHFTSYESGFYSKLSLGLRYRNRDWIEPEKSNEYRTTQQYNYSKQYNQFRIGHRVRFEQRFYDSGTEYRPRYRLNLHFPLQGLKLNSGEFYTVFSTEALYTISTQDVPALDHRFTARLGFQVSSSLKFEVFGQYRRENYLNEARARVFCFTAATIDI